MSGGPELSTDRGVPLQWWHVVAAGVAVWTLFVATLDLSGSMPAGVDDVLTALALVAWPAIPLATYLDVRSIRGEVAWSPATKSWLAVSALWIANVPAGLAYCIRRRQAVRGELPSPNWRYGVYAGLLAWIVVVGVDGVADYVGADLGAVDPVLTGLLAVAWFGLPVAVYFDAVRFSHYPDRQPRFRGLVALSAIPLVNVLAVGGYAGVRWWERRKRGPDVELSFADRVEPESAWSEPLSPWYRRAAGVFAAYLLVVVAVGWGLSLQSDGAWLGLELAAWVPFGVFFTACIHLDLRDVREAGVSWGGTRYLYYTSAVFPGPAFYYLLRRLVKVNRARSNGLLDDGEGGADEGEPAMDAVAPPTEESTGPDRSDDGSGFEWADSSRG